MSATLLEPAPVRATAAAIADGLIEASHARPLDKIAVAGASQLEFLIALLKRGFVNGACVSTGRKTDTADILIAPDIRSGGELSDALQCLAGSLRPGGVLVFRTDAALAHGNQKQLLPILLKFGFAAIERRAARSEAAEIWLARRRSAPAQAV